MTPPPLRFLIVVVGGWAFARAGGALWSGADQASASPPPPPSAAAGPGPGALGRAPAAPPGPAFRPSPARRAAVPLAAAARRGAEAAAAPARRPAPPPAPARLAPAGLAIASRPASAAGNISPSSPPPETRQDPPAARPGAAAGARRWSIAGWAQLRPGDSPSLAAGGMLGGSQAGLRFAYRLGGGAAAPLALTGRLSGPLRAGGGEAALGLEWQVSRGLPLRVAAERRQAIGGGGRSALALSVHGGVSEVPLGGALRLDAYGQAGIVGRRARDPFAEAMVRVAAPVGRRGRLRLGAGAWAAAQPGAARLDIGPGASLRLPGATVAIDWRHRAAGGAAPGSGPAFTLWSDFR